MARPTTFEGWTARAEAYQEAAEHLQLYWTDDPLELEQGKVVAEELWRRSRSCREKAAECQLEPQREISLQEALRQPLRASR